MEFARDLLSAVQTSANVKYYAEIVSEKAMLRRLIKLNEEIANICYLGKEPLEAVLETTEKKVFKHVQRRNTGDYVPIKDVVLSALEKIEKASKTNGSVTGIRPDFWIWIIRCRTSAFGFDSCGCKTVYGKDGICAEYYAECGV